MDWTYEQPIENAKYMKQVFIEQNAGVKPIPCKLIPVDFRLPEERAAGLSDDVLIFDNTCDLPVLGVYNHNDGKWYTQVALCVTQVYPTYWMKLPRLQTQESDDQNDEKIGAYIASIRMLYFMNLLQTLKND